jgi:hypothetical protein
MWAVAMALALGAVAVGRVRADVPTWPIRGIYLGAGECTDELLDALRDVGLNTLFVTNNTYDLAPLRPVVERAKARGLRVYWAMFFHGGPEIERGFADNPRRFVRQDGTVTQRTTCPLDEVYWERAAGDRALMLAQWAVTEPTIAGIAYDIEMYAGASDFDWDQFCVCDRCWAAFREGRSGVPAASALPAAERWPWLTRAGQTKEYEAFQRAGVRRITADIARRVHAIAPNMGFAILPYGTIFADDVPAGFGTAKLPCPAMREDTYSAGYRMDVEADQARLDREGAHVRILIGLWAHKRPPEQWPLHAYLSATRVGGYWLYEEFPFSRVFLRDTGEPLRFTLQGSPAEWRSAFTLANQEIDRRLADPDYRPALMPTRLRRTDYAMDLTAMPLVAPTLAKPDPVAWADDGFPWTGEYARVELRGPGEQVTFALPHRYGGPHQVYVLLAGGPASPIVQVRLDGQAVGPPLDTYSPRLTPALFEAKADLELDATPHRVTLEAVGKNPASTGYVIRAESALLYYLGPFCPEYYVIGPFPNPEHRGFTQPYPPERELKLSASYPGVDGKPVSWQRMEATGGFLDLEKRLTPKEWTVAYALTYYYSPRARPARLLLGSDDGAKVWLNGQLVWSELERRGNDADRDRVEVQLQRGWNQILVKVEQGEGGWGLRLRMTDAGPKVDSRWRAGP